MKQETLKEAVKEASRFIKLAKRALEITDPWFYASMHKSAAERASIDLTRKLADLRQNR